MPLVRTNNVVVDGVWVGVSKKGYARRRRAQPEASLTLA